VSASVWLLLAAVLLVAVGDGATGRVSRVMRSTPRDDRAMAHQRRRPRRDAPVSGKGAVVAGMAGAAALLVLVPWPAAPVVALVFIFGLMLVLPRLEPRSVRQASARRARELPLALDLLAACWSAGATPRRAAATVAEGVEGPLRADLLDVATRLELGSTAADSWRFLTEIQDDGAAQDAYRALIDASSSGVPPVDALRRAAQRSRECRRRAGEAAARTVAVKVAAPLGLCFLPAFVLLAIAPAVLGALLPAIT
jgi:pilus assembly protein TadC